MIGEMISHYRITGKLGEGGMGAVYRATDTKLNREVAIKVLPDEFAADPGRMARFTREAQVLASLNHPNIATIYGIEDRAIVMELVEGADLAGPLPLDTALDYAGQIADALEAAHEKGITHRDLKPANIKITPQGVVKVLDFGLAKISEAPSAAKPGPTATTRTSTQPGMVMGTAGYMAPEQARGQQVDKRADIWAFGVVLWEMLTGKQLFGGATVSDAIAAVLTKEPDLGAAPSKVRRLLARCLVKDPRKRLRDIGDWRDLLEESPPRPSSGRVPWIIAATLAVAAAIPWLWPQRTPADRPLLQVDLDVGAAVSSPAISPDGNRLAFVTGNRLALRRLDETKIVALPGTEGASYPFFSPDGQWIGFFANGKLQRISVQGGSPVAICDAPMGRGGSWGADGHIVVNLQSLGGLFRVPAAAGGTPMPLTDPRTERSEINSHRSPSILPDGKSVLFVANAGGTSNFSIRVLPPGAGKSKTLVENAVGGRYVAGGFLAYVQRGTLFAAPLDLSRLEITGPATRLVDGVAVDGTTLSASFDVSPSGTLVYSKGAAPPERVISWFGPSGKPEPIMGKPDVYWTPRLSPDGKRLAFVVDRQGLWIYDFTRKIPTRLTFDPDRKLAPVWTPDGEYICFISGAKLAWARSNGTGKVELSSIENGTP